MYTDSPSKVRLVSQKAKLPEEPKPQQSKNKTTAAPLFTFPRFLLIKYRIHNTKRIPEKIRKVTEVPTAGMVTKVGTNVPIMLPMVLKAPSVPTVLPLSSRLSTEYFASDGVTVPSRNNGNTKIIIQAAKAAQIRKLLFTAKISRADIPRIIYFPTTGMAAIQIAAIRILPYSLSGSGFLSALLPP